MTEETCDIVGPFSFFVQILLGFLSFLVLIIKRYKEKPKRQWKIWCLDTSKQLASAFLAHFLNLLLSVILSSNSDVDPCHWYFITVMFDTTIGVFLCYVILNQIEKLLTSSKYEKFKSGNYFNIITPDQAIQIQEANQQKTGKNNDSEKLNTNLLRPVIQVNFQVWLMQLLIWNIIVVISKSILYFIQMGLQSWLVQFAGFLFQGITNIYLELVIVMAIVPVIMNGLQFWVQDNFLKKHEFSQADKDFLFVEMFAPEDLEGLVELNKVQNEQQTQVSDYSGKKYSPNACYDYENNDAI